VIPSEEIQKIIDQNGEYRGPPVDDAEVLELFKELIRLRTANRELADALEDLVMACELPGDHCEVEDAMPKAKSAISRHAEGGTKRKPSGKSDATGH